jgi:outer membrane protein OmpA-like peptidoglycan-associated protein
MTMKKLESALALSLVLGAVGCATAPPVPPTELTSARDEVAKAKQGPAGKLDPTDVAEASSALDKAETSFSNEPYSANTVDLSVAAQRKAQVAEAKAETIQAMNNKEASERQFEAAQAAQIEEQKKALAEEQQKRMALEQKQVAACEVMGKVAKVKREREGTVVTFQSDALFGFNKSDLTPDAKTKLDSVATQLQEGFKEHKLHVMGFTDNVGGNGPGNQGLSEKRATAVKDYLVSKGISGDLIDSSGKGAAEPVGDNKTDTGRALNRRVEIIIEPNPK